MYLSPGTARQRLEKGMVAHISPLPDTSDSQVIAPAARQRAAAGSLPLLIDGSIVARFARMLEPPEGRIVAELVTPGQGAFGRIGLGTGRYSRELRHAAASDLEGMLVVAVDGGQLEGLGSGGHFIAAAGDVLLIDLEEALPLRCVELEAHFALLPTWHCDTVMMREGGWHGAVLPRAGGAAPLVRAAIAVAMAGEVENAAGLCASLSALIAAGYAHAGRARLAGSPPAGLRRFIEEHIADPDLTAARLAREFGMARASLYRHFDNMGGIAAYVRRLRLRRARELIERSAGQGLRLGTIAAEVGFASPTVFARAFRQAYGMTPRECLRQARPGPAGAARRAQAGE